MSKVDSLRFAKGIFSRRPTATQVHYGGLMKTIGKCEECLYYDALDKKEGACRRSPPQLLRYAWWRRRKMGLCGWIPTRPTDWCGEWEPKVAI